MYSRSIIWRLSSWAPVSQRQSTEDSKNNIYSFSGNFSVCSLLWPTVSTSTDLVQPFGNGTADHACQGLSLPLNERRPRSRIQKTNLVCLSFIHMAIAIMPNRCCSTKGFGAALLEGVQPIFLPNTEYFAGFERTNSESLVDKRSAGKQGERPSCPAMFRTFHSQHCVIRFRVVMMSLVM